MSKQKTYQINSTKYLSDSEQTALIQTLSKNATRDALMIEIALITGIRRQELVNLTKTSLNDDKRSIHIIGVKGSRDREIPVPDSTYRRIKQYINQSANSNPAHNLSDRAVECKNQLFPISIRRLTQIWDNYRPNPNKGFHSLRHTFAINLYKKTKDLKIVQTALGHVNIQNTMVYADYVYSTDELRKALVG